MASYYGTVLRRARKSTTWISWGKVVTAIVIPLLNLWGQWFSGWKNQNEALVLAGLAVAIYALCAVVEFVWNLLRLPPLLAREAGAAATASTVREVEATRATHAVEIAGLERELVMAREAQARVAMFERTTPVLTIDAPGGSADTVIYLRLTLYNPPGGTTVSLCDDWTATMRLPDGRELTPNRIGVNQRQSGISGVDALGSGETLRLVASLVFTQGAPRGQLRGSHWVLSVTDRQERTLRAEYDHP